MKLIRTTLLVALSIAQTLCFAQKNYQTATVITNTGDTLKGYINYKEWRINPTTIAFKTRLGAQSATDFTAKDIRSFKVADDLYVSKIVSVEMTNTENINLVELYSTKPKYQDSCVFLLTLVQAKAHLYKLSGLGGTIKFYLQKDTARPVLLIYRNAANGVINLQNGDSTQTYTEINLFSGSPMSLFTSDSTLLKSRLFKRQLSHAFADFPPKPDVLENLEYRTKPLIAIVNTYNSHFKNTNVYIKRNFDNLAWKTRIGITGGLTTTSLLVNYVGDFDKFDFNLKGSGYQAGLSVQSLVPRTHRKLFISNNLVYQKWQLKGGETVGTDEFRSITTYYVNLSNVRLYTQAHYTLLRVNKLALFVNGGLTFNYLLQSDNAFEKVVPIFPNNNRSGEIIKKENMRPLRMGFVGGLGIDLFQKFQFGYRWENENSLGRPGPTTSKFKNTQIVVTYLF